MATKAVAAAPRAISERSARPKNAESPTGARHAVQTTRADDTTAGSTPSLAGESQASAGKSLLVSVTAVTRHLSRNSAVALAPTPPKYQSLEDFLGAYEAKNKTVDNLTGKFVQKAGEAKKAQDDILPHLAFMQSLLSKKGSNHRWIAKARKNGLTIPWWTEYYEQYQGRLWESLRTMERRIANYRKDPTLPPPPPPDPVPQLRQSDRKALIDAASVGMELVTALEHGAHTAPFVEHYKKVVTRKRLDDILELSGKQSEEDLYDETKERITQNHRNHLNALANQLASMVIDKKSDDETLRLAKQIVALYKQLLRPGFLEEKARLEMAHPVKISDPKPKVRSKATKSKKSSGAIKRPLQAANKQG